MSLNQTLPEFKEQYLNPINSSDIYRNINSNMFPHWILKKYSLRKKITDYLLYAYLLMIAIYFTLCIFKIRLPWNFPHRVFQILYSVFQISSFFVMKTYREIYSSSKKHESNYFGKIKLEGKVFYRGDFFGYKPNGFGTFYDLGSGLPILRGYFVAGNLDETNHYEWFGKKIESNIIEN